MGGRFGILSPLCLSLDSRLGLLSPSSAIRLTYVRHSVFSSKYVWPSDGLLLAYSLFLWATGFTYSRSTGPY